MAPEKFNAAEPVSKADSKTQAPKSPQKKKKKKNAPDKPQPEWMFPPDQENPVLNPKPKSDAQVIKEQKERDDAIEFLHYKSVSTPRKPAPPGVLLTLVGGFLTSYGFDSASRLYTSQCAARKKLGAWDHELGVKLPKGTPSLERIFKDWYKGYEQTHQHETSSSSDEEGDSDSRKPAKDKKKRKANNITKGSAEQTSSSGSSDTSSDDSESGLEPSKDALAPALKGSKKVAKGLGTSGSSLSSSSESEAGNKKHTKSAFKAETSSIKVATPPGSSSSSSTDSDADDEKEIAGAKVHLPKFSVNGLVNKLKRKTNSSEQSSSDSDSSSSSSDEDVTPVKKSKGVPIKNAVSNEEPTFAIKPVHASAATRVSLSADSSTSSSESSSSDSSSSDESPAKQPLPASSSDDSSSNSSESEAAAPTKKSKASKSNKLKFPWDSSKSTDSSATLEGTSSKKPSTSNTSTSSSDSAAKDEPTPVKTEPTATTKRKRSLSPHAARAAMPPTKVVKSKDAPFQRVPKDTMIDPKLASNKYVSYDYAEQAHRDLSVTKGKGFTKEKNKKKRGSYRGGMIDVDGRKGIKFDD